MSNTHDHSVLRTAVAFVCYLLLLAGIALVWVEATGMGTATSAFRYVGF